MIEHLFTTVARKLISILVDCSGSNLLNSHWCRMISPMGIEVIISCIVSAIIVGIGVGLSWYAVKQGGHMPKRDPERVRQILKDINWSVLDEVMDRPPRRRSEHA